MPLTYFLEGFRAHFGFPPGFTSPTLRGFLVAMVYVAGGYAAFSWAVDRSRRTGMLLRLSD